MQVRMFGAILAIAMVSGCGSAAVETTALAGPRPGTADESSVPDPASSQIVCSNPKTEVIAGMDMDHAEVDTDGKAVGFSEPSGALDKWRDTAAKRLSGSYAFDRLPDRPNGTTEFVLRAPNGDRRGMFVVEQSRSA